jgi:hypothetical protein
LIMDLSAHARRAEHQGQCDHADRHAMKHDCLP